MPDARREIGNEGERLAAEFLKRKGLKTIDRQVRTPFGEIDLVCLDGDEVVFVEVKARRTDTFGPPEASVTPDKLRHVARSAEVYIRERHWEEKSWRIDVVAIRWIGEQLEVLHFPSVDMSGEV